MSPRLRKWGLAAHITSSLGWLGAVAAFLALGIAGLTSHDAATVRSAYLAMNLIGEFVIVPLSLATLATGVVQALGTEWGLLRYYWVLVKLGLTIGATLLLLLHQFTAVAEAAQRVSLAAGGPAPSAGRLGTQLVVDASLAITVLLAATLLSIFKPWGRIPRVVSSGSSTPPAPNHDATAPGLPLGLKVFLALIGALLIAVVVRHLTGRGPGHHGY